MKNKLQNWLEDPNADYAEGLALYHKTKRNTEYDKFLEAGADSVPKSLHHNMLRSQLSLHHRWLTDNPETTEKQPTAFATNPERPITATTKPVKTQIDVNTLPKALQIVYESNKAGQDELKTLHANMKKAENDEDRSFFRSEIIKIENYINEGWKKIKDYIKNPENWNPKTAAETNTLEILKIKRRIDNLAIYIPRDSKKLETIEDKESKRYKDLAQKIEEMKLEQEHLRQTLDSSEEIK